MTSRKAISQKGQSRYLQPYLKQACYSRCAEAFVNHEVDIHAIKCTEKDCAIYHSVGRKFLIHEEQF